MLHPHPSLTPLDIVRVLWPHVALYDKQREIFMACRESVDTFAVGCNGAGKEFAAGGVALIHHLYPWVFYPPEYVREIEGFRTPTDDPHYRRTVTTSVADHHLVVLWGEIGWWVRTCNQNLREGPDAIVMLDKQIRFAREADVDDRNLKSYLVGRVSAKGEGLAGHHAPYAMLMVDEASGMDQEVYDRGVTWRKRGLLIGNAEACINEFKTACQHGDLLKPTELAL